MSEACCAHGSWQRLEAATIRTDVTWYLADRHISQPRRVGATHQRGAWHYTIQGRQYCGRWGTV